MEKNHPYQELVFISEMKKYGIDTPLYLLKKIALSKKIIISSDFTVSEEFEKVSSPWLEKLGINSNMKNTVSKAFVRALDTEISADDFNKHAIYILQTYLDDHYEDLVGFTKANNYEFLGGPFIGGVMVGFAAIVGEYAKSKGLISKDGESSMYKLQDGKTSCDINFIKSVCSGAFSPKQA